MLATSPAHALVRPNGSAAVLSRNGRSSRLLLMSVFGAAAMTLSLVVAPPAQATLSLERLAIAKINRTRSAHGLRPLAVRTDLRRAARRHSSAMASRNRLYHSNLSRIRNFRSAAENVGFGRTVPRVHGALMRSRPHRSNVLDRRMRHVGVAVLRHDGELWVTQIFRQPR